jgi:hypothetical protein
VTFELWGCVILGALSFPVARHFAIHFAAMALFNLSLLGYSSADSTILAMMFGSVAAVDMLLASQYRSKSLAFCAFVSVTLCLEQLINEDFFLSLSSWLSAATNAFIIVAIAQGYKAWMHGKRSSY